MPAENPNHILPEPKATDRQATAKALGVVGAQTFRIGQLGEHRAEGAQEPPGEPEAPSRRMTLAELAAKRRAAQAPPRVVETAPTPVSPPVRESRDSRGAGLAAAILSQRPK